MLTEPGSTIACYFLQSILKHVVLYGSNIQQFLGDTLKLMDYCFQYSMRECFSAVNIKALLENNQFWQNKNEIQAMAEAMNKLLDKIHQAAQLPTWSTAISASIKMLSGLSAPINFLLRATNQDNKTSIFYKAQPLFEYLGEIFSQYTQITRYYPLDSSDIRWLADTQKVTGLIQQLNAIPSHEPINTIYDDTTGSMLLKLSVKINERHLFNINEQFPYGGTKYLLDWPSGAGKSTFFSIIKGIYSIVPDLSFQGSMILPPNQAIIMCPQNPVFLPSRPLIEIIISSNWDNIPEDKRPEISNRVHEILSRLDNTSEPNMWLINRLFEYQYAWANNLSGGQQKKILLASLLCKLWEIADEHKIKYVTLIMDEVFAGLDHNSAVAAMETLQHFINKFMGPEYAMKINAFFTDHNHEPHNNLYRDQHGSSFYDATLTLKEDGNTALMWPHTGIEEVQCEA